MTHFENKDGPEKKEDQKEEPKKEPETAPEHHPTLERHQTPEHRQPGQHHPPHHHQSKKKLKAGVWKTLAIALIILLAVSIYTGGFSSLKGESKEKITEKTLAFVNNQLLQGQTAAKLNSIAEKEGLYNLKLDIAGREIDTYVTKNGKLLFPQAVDMEAVPNPSSTPSDDQTAPAAPDLPKSDQPKIELFVMSHCPFGTQAEKGILPAIEKLGDKIDFELKFVYYAMHGEKEIKEQMNQVCIQQEQNENFNSYLKCFLDQGEGKSCLTTAKIDQDKLSACVKKLDAQFQVIKKLNDQSTWLSGRYPLFDVYKEENDRYQIGGSPTLIINGQPASSERSPAAYLSVICAAFNEAPEECQTELSTASFSPGFGYEAGADTAASCG